jgi:transcriptional regulator with XRE-family HTH domain
MTPLRSVRQLCEQQGVEPAQLADRTGLERKRVAAILDGRWTASPTERARIAAALGVQVDAIEWSYQVSVEHLHGHGPQFGRTP